LPPASRPHPASSPPGPAAAARAAPIPNRFLAAAVMGANFAIVGSSVPAGKLLLAAFPIALGMALRYGAAALILYGLLRWREGAWPRLKRADLALLALQAFLGLFLFSLTLLHGLRHAPALEAGILLGAIPAAAALLAALFLHERPGAIGWAGIALTVAGAAGLRAGGATASGTAGEAPLLGLALVAVSVLCEGAYVVIAKRLAPALSPLAQTFGLCAIAALLFLPEALLDLGGFSLAAPGALGWAVLAHFTLAVTVGAFLLFYLALPAVSATLAGAATACIPLAAAILSVAVLGEPVRPAHIVAALLVVGGIVAVAADRPRPVPVAQSATPP